MWYVVLVIVNTALTNDYRKKQELKSGTAGHSKGTITFNLQFSRKRDEQTDHSSTIYASFRRLHNM